MRSMLHKTEVNLDWTTRRCSVTLNDFAYELKERVLCEYLGHKLLECYLTPTDIQIIVSNTKQYCMMHHEVGSTIDRETAFRLYSL